VLAQPCTCDPRAAPGEHHQRGCPRTRRCTCRKPSYRGVVWSKAEGKNLYGPWGARAEAVSWRAQAHRELSQNGSLPSKVPAGPTVAEAADEFLAGARDGTRLDRKGHRYKDATIRGYERGLRRVKNALGQHRRDELRRQDVQAFVDQLVREGHAPSTIRNTLDPLRAMYRHAVRRGLVAVNPTTELEVPHDRSEEMRVASRAEATELTAALPESEWAFWATALYAGLRSGELRALRWSDVDLGTRLIHVRRSWDDGGQEVEPKTPGSRRRVPVVPRLAKLLERHRELTDRSGDDLVFGRTAETPFERSTIRRRALAAWKTAKLEPITVHQCRHTCASFMIAAGANAKALSVILGHASIAITFDRYGHLMKGGEDEVGRLLDRYINGA
jgi:integrase